MVKVTNKYNPYFPCRLESVLEFSLLYFLVIHVCIWLYAKISSIYRHTMKVWIRHPDFHSTMSVWIQLPMSVMSVLPREFWINKTKFMSITRANHIEPDEIQIPIARKLGKLYSSTKNCFLLTHDIWWSKIKRGRIDTSNPWYFL